MFICPLSKIDLVENGIAYIIVLLVAQVKFITGYIKWIYVFCSWWGIFGAVLFSVMAEELISKIDISKSSSMELREKELDWVVQWSWYVLCCVVLWSSMVSPFIKMTFGFGFHFVSSLDHPSCGLPTHSKYPQTQSHISHNSKISPIFLCLWPLSPLDLEQLLILENNKKSEDQILRSSSKFKDFR